MQSQTESNMAGAVLAGVRKERIFRNRLTLDDLTDDEIVRDYRLDRQSITMLNMLLEDDVNPKTERSRSLSSITKIMMALRYLAKGDFLSEIASIHGASKSTACISLWQVVHAINRRIDNIRFPNEQEILNNKTAFYRRCRIPNVIGAVDGTLVSIIAPKTDEAVYVSRKGRHSVNIQATCDCDLRFIDVVAMWPGSQHDSAVFNASGIKDYLEQSNAGMLLGDSGYPLRRYLLTPMLQPRTPQHERFNLMHSRGRMVIEKAFGVLKSRFRCLSDTGGRVMFSPERTCQVFLACARLHNLCIDRHVPEPPLLPFAPECQDDPMQPNDGPADIRQRIVNMF